MTKVDMTQHDPNITTMTIFLLNDNVFAEANKPDRQYDALLW